MSTQDTLELCSVTHPSYVEAVVSLKILNLSFISQGFTSQLILTHHWDTILSTLPNTSQAFCVTDFVLCLVWTQIIASLVYTPGIVQLASLQGFFHKLLVIFLCLFSGHAQCKTQSDPSENLYNSVSVCQLTPFWTSSPWVLLNMISLSSNHCTFNSNDY